MKKTLLVDIDDTTIMSMSTIYDIYKEETNTTGEMPQNYLYSFEGVLPKNYVNRALELFESKEFFDRVQIMPNCKETLYKYKDKFDIKFCSIHNHRTAYRKIDYINKHFPFIKDVIILKNNGTFDKSIVKGDIIIDDKLSCVKGNRECKILFGDYFYNYPINLNYKEIELLSTCVQAKDWLEVDKILERL